MNYYIHIVVFLFFSILILNTIFLRIYSGLSKKAYSKRISKPHSLKKASKKVSLLKYVKLYMSGYVRYSLRLLAMIPSHRIRNFYYKHVFLMNLGKNAVIYGGAEIRAPWNIEIGENSIIGDESKLDGRNGIIIGKNVNFSTGVWIWTDQHIVNSVNFECLDPQKGMVRIKDRAWLGPRTIVLPGKTIEEGAVVAAGSVVTKDCENFGIYGGIPAKKIGERNSEINYEFSGVYLPFY